MAGENAGSSTNGRVGAFGDYPRARVSSYLAELCQQHGLGHFGTFLTPAATQKAVANDFHRPRPVGTNNLGVCRRRRETPSVGIFVSRKVTVLTLRGDLGSGTTRNTTTNAEYIRFSDSKKADSETISGTFERDNMNRATE